MTAQELFDQGCRLEEEGKLEEAIATFAAVVRLAPDQTPPHEHLFRIHLHRRDVDAAWCVASMLFALDALDDDGLELYEDYAPKRLPPRTGRLDAAGWDLLRDPEEQTDPSPVASSLDGVRGLDPSVLQWAADALGVDPSKLPASDAEALEPRAPLDGARDLFTLRERLFIAGREAAKLRGARARTQARAGLLVCGEPNVARSLLSSEVASEEDVAALAAFSVSPAHHRLRALLGTTVAAGADAPVVPRARVKDDLDGLLLFLRERDDVPTQVDVALWLAKQGQGRRKVRSITRHGQGDQDATLSFDTSAGLAEVEVVASAGLLTLALSFVGASAAEVDDALASLPHHGAIIEIARKRATEEDGVTRVVIAVRLTAARAAARIVPWDEIAPNVLELVGPSLQVILERAFGLLRADATRVVRDIATPPKAYDSARHSKLVADVRARAMAPEDAWQRLVPKEIVAEGHRLFVGEKLPRAARPEAPTLSVAWTSWLLVPEPPSLDYLTTLGADPKQIRLVEELARQAYFHITGRSAPRIVWFAEPEVRYFDYVGATSFRPSIPPQPAPVRAQHDPDAWRKDWLFLARSDRAAATRSNDPLLEIWRRGYALAAIVDDLVVLAAAAPTLEALLRPLC